jgi:CMP-N,N'-diacetyllegionaminic acid synthase
MPEVAKILAIIPARGGSKRVPGKNKKMLAGKPLIAYAIEAVLQSSIVNKVVVSSDDDDILSIAQNYEKVTALRRPVEISGDEATAITYVQHALDSIQESFDTVVIVQPSSPLTKTDDINATIDLLHHHPEADSAVSVMKLDHAIHPIKLKTMDQNVLKPYVEEEKGRMAAHELPELYVRNCSVYVSKIDTISKGSILGDISVGYVMPRERSIDINDPIDFEFAEFLIEKSNGK